MIHVKRSNPTPAALGKENREGLNETARVIQKYEELERDNDLAGFKFDFKAYSDREVRRALEHLFHGKCAYCEGRYAGAQPMDVEHWRPKAKIVCEDGQEIKPGYYWLAADWENLLPSCIDCNRSRYQKVPPKDEEVRLGKENQFPLADEDDRCRNHRGDVCREDPLLLNPCLDKPEAFLAFTPDGFVRPRPGEGRDRAAASIRVYALNRAGLVYDRREVLALIERLKFAIVKLMELWQELGSEQDDLIPLVEALLEHEIETLRRFRESERPFAQMARQVIDAFFATVDPDGG